MFMIMDSTNSQIITPDSTVYAPDGSQNLLIFPMYLLCALPYFFFFIFFFFNPTYKIFLFSFGTGCLRCSMEELSRKFTDSYCCFWDICFGGQYIESVFWSKSEGDVLCLAFHFFNLPLISAWSLVFFFSFITQCFSNILNSFVIHGVFPTLIYYWLVFVFSFLLYFLLCSIIFILSIASLNYLLVKVRFMQVCVLSLSKNILMSCKFWLHKFVFFAL
jgi:hypothetical protein